MIVEVARGVAGDGVTGLHLAVSNSYDVIDLGVMVPCDRILETAIEQKADLIDQYRLFTVRNPRNRFLGQALARVQWYRLRVGRLHLDAPVHQLRPGTAPAVHQHLLHGVEDDPRGRCRQAGTQDERRILQVR